MPESLHICKFYCTFALQNLFNMDKSVFRTSVLCISALVLTGCWTRIFTVAPTTEYVAPVKTVYTTKVTTPAPKQTVTTTVTVTSFNEDISFYLDLQAVGAAFAESRNVAEFEQLLNSSRYMINNLDLNRDGWIDYLRVLETRQGNYHVFLLQACLAPSVFQDVATVFAERRANLLFVEVIGDRYLYGPNYIVRPVFSQRPPLWDAFGRPTYNPWSSPYYYGSWPSYYTQPKPIYLTHYQAYVTTYISHHHYYHNCEYPSHPYYDAYARMTQPVTRRDYQNAHPEGSFEERVTRPLTASGSGVSVRNAGQLRSETQASAKREQASSGTTSTSTRQTSTSSSTRQTSSETTTKTTTTSGTSTRQPASTTVESRVSNNGTTRTTIKQTDASGKTTTTSRTSAPRQAAQSGSTNTRTSGSSTSTRSSGTSSSGSNRSSGTRSSEKEQKSGSSRR